MPPAPLESRLSANIFLHVPPLPPRQSLLRSTPTEKKEEAEERDRDREKGRKKSKRTLVFFIPGNPGLVGYYRPFLTLVARGLRGAERQIGHEGGDGNQDSERGERRAAAVVVAGMSLGGFDVDEEPPRSGKNDDNDVDDNNKSKRKNGEEEQGEERHCDDHEWNEDEVRDGDGNVISSSPGPRCSILAEDRELLYPPSFRLRSRHGQRHKDRGNADRKENGRTAGEQHKIYPLREQIELSYARMEYLVQRLQQERSLVGNISKQQEPVEVVLVGHSVGAYIALEIVRLWHERRHHHQHPQQPPPPLGPSRTVDFDGKDDDDTPSSILDSPKTRNGLLSSPSWSISTCILLTPTIQDIHLSPSGQIATPLLRYLPFLPGLAHMLLHAILLRLLPSAWFSWLVSGATGMEKTSHGFETTMAFLRSKRGVKQALFMARGEMNEIRRDKWGEEVWGASHSGAWTAEDDHGRSAKSPRLFFWFAKKDHWIANVTKEAIFDSRAADVGVQRERVTGPRSSSESVETEEEFMGQDQDSKKTTGAARIQILETEAMVHAWCLNQSEYVARRVSGWLMEVLDENHRPLLRNGRSSPKGHND
ncbi:uncharacterized protein Z519_02536 [Cladophialophora bantiana CBS 173.52]|uniref:Uncharacterized protein n=1 Tax=Cladophialophora bantiana (strain ATCC 10958 / CBS 173.52 / CDC B-1940 / NIH 8579) TaxID=1442370 RepID=A0A0D2IK10_CLAB1|nr:uncharacterized protein Z519_02536 [Cladophialophora bantiana CBS 173.52]KIW97144.1 hypothetical protein Z519_02536 [Cladophialophora bantiana CBS 173.52]